MPIPSSLHEYMAHHSVELGNRILLSYPPLHSPEQPLSPRIAQLLRQPYPAQALAIMGVAERWKIARGAHVVAECGAGKTLIALGMMFVHADGEAVFRNRHGSAAPGREVGARDIPDLAFRAGVPDRRHAQRRRSQAAARGQRSPAAAWRDRSRRPAHQLGRYAKDGPERVADVSVRKLRSSFSGGNEPSWATSGSTPI